MLKKIFTFILIFLASCNLFSQKQIKSFRNKKIPPEVQILMQVYPDFIVGYRDNYIIWADSTKMIFDDHKNKSFDELLNNPDIQDMFKYPYRTGKIDTPQVNYDPGRIRNEAFFRKMYGNSAEEVRKNLVPVKWLPSSVNKTIYVTNINGVNKALQAVSDELDTIPELRKYVERLGGTFNWRVISGTNRLSAHSFGIAIDINVKYSNYWRWDMKYNGGKIIFHNKIPLKLVEIFEKHGFIWGGRWYHYDTMHFEYRPELLANK